MSKVFFMYGISVWENNGVSIGGAYSIKEAERKFNESIRRCNGTEHRVVLDHGGIVSTGNSRYQAELALNYLKDNYPTYTNFRIGGTGEWDDPYYATMDKILKVYDVRVKQIYNMEATDEK